MSCIPPRLVASVLMIDRAVMCAAYGFVLMPCVISAVQMRRHVIVAAVTMRGTQMSDSTLHDEHHRDGEYLHHPVGYGNEPSNARHALRLVILNTPGRYVGRRPKSIG